MNDGHLLKNLTFKSVNIRIHRFKKKLNLHK